MKTIVIILTITLFVFASCSYTSYPTYVTTSYPHTDPEKVLIYPKSIDQDYEVIGLVGADVKGDSIAAIEKIKKKAAKQGADAIIHFSLNQLSTSEITGGSGVAVKLVRTVEVKYSLR